MSAVLFGSMSTLSDTSELQRAAFNDAFAQHGLDWSWSREEYAELLSSSGGQGRIADYAQARGEDVDAAAVHETKSELFRAALRSGDVQARPGVVQTIEDARAAGFAVALVTTTSPENVAALTDALEGTIEINDFDLVVDSSLVDEPKPAGDVYTYALDQLGVNGGQCVAVEDNVGGLRSAVAAGVECVAFPNQNTSDHDFEGSVAEVDTLEFTSLRGSVMAD